MLRLTNIILRRQCACRGISFTIDSIPVLSQKTDTSVAPRLRSKLSRSRAPVVQTLDFISRLPARPSCTRLFSSADGLRDDEVQKRVENISEKFKEAMELLDDARSSFGTVYFSDDMNDVERAIEEVLSDYDKLMKEMTENQKRNVVRTIGLKIEELKAQVQMLKESLKD